MVACVFGVLFLFLVVQLIGRPIRHLGSEPLSVLYSLAVYVPVIVVCVFALWRAGRRRP